MPSQFPLALSNPTFLPLVQDLTAFYEKEETLKGRTPIERVSEFIEKVALLENNLVKIKYFKKEGIFCTRLASLHPDCSPTANGISNPINAEKGTVTYFDLQGQTYVIRQFSISQWLSAEVIFDLTEIR